MNETPINLWQTIEWQGPEFLANYLSELRDLVLGKKYASGKILAVRAARAEIEPKDLPKKIQLFLNEVYKDFKNRATLNEIRNINRSIEELGEIMTEEGILKWAKDNSITLDENDLKMARDLTQIYLDNKKRLGIN